MVDERPLLFFDSGAGAPRAGARARPAASVPARLRGRQWRLSLWREDGSRDRRPRAGRCSAGWWNAIARASSSSRRVQHGASTIALPVVRAALDLPVVGTVPAIKPAAETSETRRHRRARHQRHRWRQPYVDRLSAEFAADCTVLRHGSARLVELAEAKLRGEATPPEDLSRRPRRPSSISPGGERMDMVVLAWHPFPAGGGRAVRSAAPRPLSFVHGGQGIARRIAHLDPGPELVGCARAGNRGVHRRRSGAWTGSHPALADHGLKRMEIPSDRSDTYPALDGGETRKIPIFLPPSQPN